MRHLHRGQCATGRSINKVVVCLSVILDYRVSLIRQSLNGVIYNVPIVFFKASLEMDDNFVFQFLPYVNGSKTHGIMILL